MAIVYLFVAIGLFLGVAAYYISEKYKNVAEEEGLTENKSSLFGPCDKACVYCPPKSFDDEAKDVLNSLNDEDAIPIPQELYERSMELVKDIDPGDLSQPLPEERLDGSNYIETKTLAEILGRLSEEGFPPPQTSDPEHPGPWSDMVLLSGDHARVVNINKKKKAVAKNKNASSKTKKSNKKAGTK